MERNSRVSRRALLLGAAGLLGAGGCARPAQARELTVYKTPYCGCCGGWITHMRRAGFQAEVKDVEDLAPIRDRYGIPFALSSCHTAVIGGYAVEGHVPPADVIRLLEERPQAIALLVPGMPIGSPGMEAPDGTREPFESVLLLDRQGRTKVFARHA